jgi:hypothetical protein
MKRKSIVIPFVFILSMITLWALNNYVMASNKASIDSFISKPTSFAEFEIELEKLVKLKETTIQQRTELIKQLSNIVKDPNSRSYSPILYKAVEIMGDIRAIEAIDILLDIVVGQSNINDMPITSAGSSSTQLNVSELIRRYPPIGPIIKIHPPYQNLIKRLKNEDRVDREVLYSAILLGSEGTDVSQFLIEKAIKEETETRKIERLKSSLSTIKESKPIKQGDIK